MKIKHTNQKFWFVPTQGVECKQKMKDKCDELAL